MSSEDGEIPEKAVTGRKRIIKNRKHILSGRCFDQKRSPV